jgi:class 3 adenylate cyclase
VGVNASDAQRCPHCGSEVDEGQRFCGSCGGLLAFVCPACQTENPLSNRFCGSCGAELVRPEPVRDVEERKVITVLFADLVGFTSRAEELDPEDVRGILSRYYARLRSDLEAHGGTVEKFIGDAVMAVFGAPVAHGDDPERAVRAALAIRESMGRMNDEDQRLDLQLRVGVNTGEAIVTLGSEASSGEGMVAGDVVNTAARLQTAAPQNGILVGQETYRATNGRITYEEIEPLDLKGKQEPVRAWVALTASSLGVERRRLAPLVGRDSELLVLRRIWEETFEANRPRLITLLGPPGIGKSRLAGEFAAEITQNGGRILTGRSMSYGTSGTYLAFRHQVKDLAGIFENDPPDLAHQKLEQAVGAVLGTDDADEVVEHIALLIGLRAADVGDRQVLFFSARRLVEALARQQPTLLVYEDVQWADSSLLDLVEHLASRVRDVPLVLLALARPELLDSRPGWGSRLPSYSSIPLEPLGEDDSRELARELLRSYGEGKADRLAATAEGNPLFIEELAASLAEGATATDKLPTNVRAIVSARLDALPATERSLVLDASVVGRVFWRRVLESLGWDNGTLSGALDSLEQRDLVRRDPVSRVGGDQQFSFKHALIRDVAYATLPRAKRRSRHAAVARFVEEDAGELDAVAAFLAHHWREAGDVDRAVDYFLTAAERASRGWAKEEAVQFYDRALELVPTDQRERRRRLVLARSVVAQAATHIVDAERLQRLEDSES